MRPARVVLLAVLGFACRAALLSAQGGTVSVTPDGGTAIKPANVTGQTVTFTVASSGTGEAQLYDLSCGTTGNTSSCSAPGQVTVPANGSSLVQVTFSTGAVGTGTVSLTAATANCVPGDDLGCVSDGGSYTVTVTNVGFPPGLNADAYNPLKQDYGVCALSCFAATTAFGTVPYFSLDRPRNVTLVYNGDRVNPRPFVHVDVSHDPGSPYTPSEYRFEVKVNGANVTFVNNETVLHFAYLGTVPYRLAGQFDASTYATGVYDMEIIVSSVYPGGLVSSSALKKLVVVNETSSPVARGWRLAGIQQLYPQGDGSALVTEGDGSAVYFWTTCPATCMFTSPAGELSHLSVNSGVYTRAYPDSTKVTFNSTGRMIGVADRFGTVTTFTYDASNRLYRITDPNSRITTLAYGTYGLSSITDPFSRVTTVTVQANGTLTSITDPDNLATSYGYDGSLRLQTITDRRGKTTTLAYDAQSLRLASVTAPAVAVFGEGTVSPVTTLASWQKLGVPYGSTSTPFSPPRSDTVRATVTDPGGHVARFTVNRFGQPLVATGPLGDTTTTTYNANAQVLSIAPRLGIGSSYGYDASGFMTSWSVNSQTTTARYGSWGQADSISGGGGPGQRIFLGANGRVDSVRIGGVAGQQAAQQTVTRYTYDTRGRLLTAKDPQQHLLAQRWYGGVNDNTSKDSLPGPQVMTYGYDTYGRPTTVTPNGLPTRTTNFDALNRPTNAYDGVNASPTAFAYEDSLHLTRVTDPAGQVYRFAYNAVGWLTQRTDPVSRADGYEYDRDGAARRWTNRRGQTVDQTYDALHRQLVRTVRNTGTDSLTNSLTYSGDARVITGSSAVSTETLYLDPRFRPDSVRTVMGGRTFWRRYHYTGQFLDTMSATIDNGAFTFLQRLYAVTPARGTLDSLRLGSNWTRFRFTPDLNATVTHFPGTDSLVRGFTERHGPDSIRAGSALYDRYGYDGFARVQQVTDALSSPNKYRQFSYDSLGHLRQTTFGTIPTGCSWTMQNGWRCTGGGTDSTHTFAYDSVGNRRDHGGTYTTGNRITAFNGCTYGTDYDGNVTSRSYAAAPCPNQNLTFTWSADNRLASFAVAGGASVTMDYDAFGRLVRRSVNGSARSYFLWDGDNLLAELDGTAAGKVAEYSWYGLDNLHAIVREAFAHHAETDALGNVRALTNLTGLVTRTNTYDEWGRLIAATDTALGDSARVRWKGALWLGPEAELYYMRNRWYEPWTGRFISEDPIGLSGGINPYAFLAAEPINGSDPFGLLCGVGKNPPCTTSPIDATAPQYYWPVSGPSAMAGDQFNCYDGAVCVSGTIGGAGGNADHPRLKACAESAAGTVVSFALDAAGASLVNSVRTVRQGLAVRAFAAGAAARAGGFAGTQLGLRVGGIAVAAFARSYDLVERGLAQGAARPIFNGLAPSAPFEAPAWYSIARSLPVIGTGVRLAETALVCTGTSP